MRNYKTRIPGIDRAGEAKNPGKAGSSALQKVGEAQGKTTRATNYREAPMNFKPTPGTSSKKFLGGIAGKMGGGKSKLGMFLNPAAALAEKLGAGPDTTVGKILNPLSIFKRK